MAADDAAVVVTLRANVKDYETALKNAVRATERAAAAADKAVSAIGKGGGKSFAADIQKNFSKSSAQMVNDARILQFQINDIFSGLASGQGIRAVQQQLGQIAQQMGGGGLAQGARTMSTALLGMLSPINLAVVGFGVLATAAASFFSESEDESVKAAESLREQLDVLDAIKARWGEAIPGIARYVEAVKKSTEEVQKHADALTLIKAEWETVAPAVVDVQKEVTKLAGVLRLNDMAAQAAELQRLHKAWREEVDAGRPGLAQLQALQDKVNALAKSGIGNVVTLADTINTKLEPALKKVSDHITTIQQMLGNMVLPDLGQIPPVTSGGGRFLNPQELQEYRARRTLSQAELANPRIVLETQSKPGVNVTDLKNELVEPLARLLKEFPDAVIRSGFRTRQEQEDAYRRLHGKGAVAEPGKSRHEVGGAADIDIPAEQYAAFERRAKELGLMSGRGFKPFSDPGHFQLAGRGEDVASIKDAKTSYDELVKSINDKIEAQQRENEINADGTLSTDAKTDALQREKAAQEAAKIELDLNAAALAQYGVVTDDVKAKNHELAAAYAAAGLAAEQLSVKQKKAAKDAQEQVDAAKQLAQQITGAAQSALGGLIQDLRNGVDAGEAFNNMLNRILDSMIQIALQQLFAPKALGGIIGSLVGVPSAAGGGIVGSTITGRQKVNPLVFAGAPSMASGGMISGMGVPIIAHPGELVVPKSLVGKLGGATKIDVGSIRVSVNTGPDRVIAGTDKGKELAEQINRVVGMVLVKESRPGGILRELPKQPG